jgi:hypothetical protein
MMRRAKTACCRNVAPGRQIKLRLRPVQRAPHSPSIAKGMFLRAIPIIAFVGLSAAAFGVAAPACAMEHGGLGEMLFGAPRTPAPTIARYSVDAGERFVLDVAPGKPAYLKFEDNSEIWALHPTSGPRGDIIYKNDMDEPMVRATRLGGLTLFTPDQPEGMPAAFMGQGAALRIPVEIGPEVLWNIFVQASARASRSAQRLIVFEGPQDITPTTAPVFADAALVCSQAFARVGAKSKTGRGLIARFSKVEFNAGRGPNAFTRGEVVLVIVAPDEGVAGRPSSERIASVISRK